MASSNRAAAVVNKRLKSIGVNARVTGGMMQGALVGGAAAAGLALVGSAKAAIDWESAFAGVRKTVDATPKQFATLESGIRDLSKEIPTSANELAGLGEIAGQLGVPLGEGGKDMMRFIRTTADLGETTNLAGEEAATSLARLANIMDRPISEVGRMGSTIVDLGNNLATTESEIANFALRIAGAGKVAGLASSDVFAIGGAFSSVGVQAERGGTAVSKVLQTMVQAVDGGGEALDLLAETAGVSASQFASAFRDDAAEAFTLFVEGLGRQGDDAFATLEELNLSDQRLMQSFVALAGAGDLLRESIERGNRAFEENTALSEEAQQRYETTAARLDVLKNNVVDVAVVIGDSLLPAINSTLGPLTDLIDLVGDLESATGAVSFAVTASINPFKATQQMLERQGDTTSEVTRKMTELAESMTGFEHKTEPLISRFGGMEDAIEGVGEAFRENVEATFVWQTEVEKSVEQALSPSSFSDKARQSFAAFEAEMRKNIEAMRDWGKNLETVAANTSRESAALLAQLGPEFAPVVADLVEQGESGFRQLEQLAAEVNLDSEGNITIRTSEAERTLDAMRALAADKGSAVGVAAAAGVESGFSARMGQVQRAMVARMIAATNMVKSALGISSPSRLTAEELGIPLAQGVAEGFEAGSEEIEEAVRSGVADAVEAGQRAFEDARGDFISAFASFGRSVSSAFGSEFDVTSAFGDEDAPGSVLGILRQQQKEAASWASNLKKLAKSGLDDGLLQELAEAGPKAAPLISQLLSEVRAGNLEAINRTQRKMEESLNSTIKLVGAQLSPAFAEGLGVGRSTVEGMAEGIAAGSPAVRAALARATREAMQEPLRLLPRGATASGDLVDLFFRAFLGRSAGKVGLGLFTGKSVGTLLDSILASDEFRGLQGRAHGGPVKAGVPYWVGEKGRELFVPRMSGDVVSNRALSGRKVGGDGGSIGRSVSVSVGQIVVQGSDDPRATAQAVRRELIQLGRRNNGTGL